MDHGCVVPGSVPFHLLEEMTDGFSESRKIGSGSYGIVYMGVNKDGEKIAVKMLNDMIELDNDKFQTECLNLACLHHQNIVQLVGYCHETRRRHVKYNGQFALAHETKRVLCLEYMHNGSLENFVSDESKGHDWCTQYTIIKGICNGLKYLHEELESPMYHLDLKLANVLLNENMVPKIADFGLSRFFEEQQTQRTKSIIGTREYLPPEYIEGEIISIKSDIFSLGVVIMKILRGPKGHFRSAEMSSQKFIKTVHDEWRNKLQARSEYEWESYSEQVKSCIEIALSCLETDRSKRPSIGDIVHKLNQTETMLQFGSGLTNNQKLPLTDRSKRPSIGDIVHKLNQTETMLQFGSGLTNNQKLPFSSINQKETKPQHLKLQHLKDITNNFSEELILGRGGFGVVYKGVRENGEKVAVKKLLQAIPSSEQQFENEVELLIKLKHPNVVRLVGYCYNTERLHMYYERKSVFAWNTDCLLCLEYLPNRSLDEYISDASSGLDWHTRCKIIEGISSGLLYLHEQSNDPIIHVDLKPANILLDENMTPKITDFGLSRLFDQKQTIRTTIASGTRGYMPPDHDRGKITPMWDIFSFGVIIMEVITGHRDYPYPHEMEKSAKGFIERELEKWRNVLQNEPGYTSLETDSRQIERCIQIGLICVNPERTERPTMKKIVDMLHGSESMNFYISNELSCLRIQEEP